PGTGFTDRDADEARCERLGLDALLSALGRDPIDGAQARAVPADAIARARLLARPFFGRDGRRLAARPDEVRTLFPGSFDPPHFGHVGMATASARATGRPPAFCLTLHPPHKLPLSTAVALQRVRQLRGQDVLISEGDPLYLDKGRRHPGCAFLMGADALDRMLDPRWCPVLPMLAEFDRLGTRFQVVGRATAPPAPFANVPQAFRHLFSELPGRFDVSSTDLRRQTG
ncbi:MAG TPA: hypothetical protein VMB50_00775, partial [Myxococcales bacterium]|nr:hypothetical protein [Myxococcales bacterium]